MNPSLPVHVELHDWASARQRALPLRMQVFVIEQGVPADIEEDDFDPQSRHALACTADGTVVATGRLLSDGHVGRMAVDARWRGRGLGAVVLQALLGEAARQGLDEVLLHAQLHACAFYARQGFRAEGEPFMEAGIPHCLMRRSLLACAGDER